MVRIKTIELNGKKVPILIYDTEINIFGDMTVKEYHKRIEQEEKDNPITMKKWKKILDDYNSKKIFHMRSPKVIKKQEIGGCEHIQLQGNIR